MKDESILELIEATIKKIKTSHNPSVKKFYVTEIKELCEAYQAEINADLLNQAHQK